MRVDLSGRTALVTGSTRGIGLATAQGLAGCGATVIVNGRTEEAVETAVASIRAAAADAEVRGFSADITTPEGVAALLATEPAIDIIVSNAATFDWTSFFDTVDEDWRRHFDINVMAAVRLARASMPGMLDRNGAESSWSLPNPA